MDTIELKKTFSDTEILVLESYEKGNFDKFGVNKNSELLSNNFGGGWKRYYDAYKDMEKYGSFKLYFPDKFKARYMPFGTRLTESNFAKLRQIRKDTGKTTQTIINDLIENV